MSLDKSSCVRSAAAAATVLVIGTVALWGAAVIPVSPISDPVGSATFPLIIGFGLLACGLKLLAETIDGGWNCIANDAQEPATDTRSIGWVVLAYLTAVTILVFSGSFVLAATLLFVISVRAFRRGVLFPSLMIGLVAAVATYVLFSGLLGLEIGEGPPERVLRWIIRF